MAYSEFATDPCRSLFKRVQTLFAPGKTLPDNANVNVDAARRALHRDDRDADARAVRPAARCRPPACSRTRSPGS